MKFKYLMKSAYYGIKHLAHVADNSASLMFQPSYSGTYLIDCLKTEDSLKEKAKENFKLAFQGDIVDKL